MILTFANKQFSVSSEKINAPYDMSGEHSINTEKQEAAGKKPLTHIKGQNLSTFKLSTLASVNAGLIPKNEIADWEKILNACIPYMIIMGNRKWGENKYLLTAVSESDIMLTPNGGILSCTIVLTFEEYVGQGQAKTTKSGESPGLQGMVTDNYGINNYTADEKNTMKRKTGRFTREDAMK